MDSQCYLLQVRLVSLRKLSTQLWIHLDHLRGHGLFRVRRHVHHGLDFLGFSVDEQTRGLLLLLLSNLKTVDKHIVDKEKIT